MRLAVVASLIVLAVLLSSSNAYVTWDQGQAPKYCHELNCPYFVQYYTNQSAAVDYRKYEKAFWARTNITGRSFGLAENVGFQRLFEYISGNNTAGAKIEMTAPVTIEVYPGAGPFCETTFIVSFFVPNNYQDKNNPPPRPTSPLVYLQELPATNFAVYNFGGYTYSWESVVGPIQNLTYFLVSQNKQFVVGTEFIAAYNSPFLPVDRHNEIWITLEN